MQIARRFIVILVTATALAGGRPAQAQAQPDIAAVTAPQPGQTVSGVVAIAGSAAGPRFLRYELAFGYDPDPTGTWFSIQEASTTAVVDGALGRWDTSGIVDGLYVLRLRVYTSEREFVEALVRGVRVQNATPPTTVAAPATVEPPTATRGPAALEPTATAPLIALPRALTPRPTAGAGSVAGRGNSAGAGLSAQAVQAAFGAGVQLTLIIFGMLGAYLGLKAIIRALWRRRPQR
jgi:hypothetical protein